MLRLIWFVYKKKIIAISFSFSHSVFLKLKKHNINRVLILYQFLGIYSINKFYQFFLALVAFTERNYKN